MEELLEVRPGGVRKGLGQQGMVPEGHMGEEVGLLPRAGQEPEAAVLHDELEAFHPVGGAPAHPPVAVPEGVAGGPPRQHRHRLAVPFGDLPPIIPNGAASAQRMMRVEWWIAPGGLRRDSGVSLHPARGGG
mgnify:CR=1 FL=1